MMDFYNLIKKIAYLFAYVKSSTIKPYYLQTYSGKLTHMQGMREDYKLENFCLDC